MSEAENSSPVTAAVVELPLDNEPRSQTERRRRHRVKVALPARVRPFDPRLGHLEEVQHTLNFSRDGLYFGTWAEYYCPGMRVLITFPCCSRARNRREYLGKIVRIERLPDGRRGVAVRFVF